jgi:1,4-dihydroxy-2-naphthoate octaprenyltransferase
MTDGNQTDLFRHIRPIHLMTALVLYLTGAGLARYLGARLDFTVFGLGLSWLLCLYLGVFLLGDYFRITFEAPILPARPTGDSREGLNKSSPSNLLLYGALALFSAVGVLTILMGLSEEITPAVAVVLVGCFGFSTLLVMPGLNIKYSGISEFLIPICLVVFPPGLSFLTQYGEFHRFLSLSIFPLFPLHLALILTLRLRSYPEDYRLGRKTLMVRLGWVKGIFLHNLLVLSAFILFGAAILFGLPLRIIGPVFLTLLPAGYLIWVYSGLERGAPVRWSLIIFLALVVFFLPVYMITFTAWIF